MTVKFHSSSTFKQDSRLINKNRNQSKADHRKVLTAGLLSLDGLTRAVCFNTFNFKTLSSSDLIINGAYRGTLRQCQDIVFLCFVLSLCEVIAHFSTFQQAANQ